MTKKHLIAGLLALLAVRYFQKGGSLSDLGRHGRRWHGGRGGWGGWGGWAAPPITYLPDYLLLPTVTDEDAKLQSKVDSLEEQVATLQSKLNAQGLSDLSGRRSRRIFRMAMMGPTLPPPPPPISSRLFTLFGARSI